MRGIVKGGELDQGSNSVKRNGMPVLDITEHKIFLTMFSCHASTRTPILMVVNEIPYFRRYSAKQYPGRQSFMMQPLEYNIPEAVIEDTGMSMLNKKGENIQISPNW